MSEQPTTTSFPGILSQRYFRRLWIVTTVSSLGDWLGVFALTIFVQQLSGRDEFAVGGVLLFRVLPGLFFGPFAGVLADRFDRRRLMITSDLARAALIASIPWVHNLWALFAVSAAMEMLSLLWTPSKDAMLPNLVRPGQLMTANQLSLVTTYATFPIAGGLVTALAGFASLLARLPAFEVLRTQPSSLAFFVDAATFLFSASIVATFPLRLTRAKRARETFGARNALRDLSEGLRFIRTDRMVRTLVVGAWTAFTGGGAVISLGPIFAQAVAGGSRASSQAAWGALIVAVGSGLVGGMVAASWVARRVKRERIFPFGLALSGLAVIGTAAMTSLRPAIIMVLPCGFGAGLAWVTIFTLLQERVEDRLRGRIFATLYTGIQISLFAALAGWPLIAGAIGDHVVRVGNTAVDLSGFRIVLASGGVFLVIAGLWAVSSMSRVRAGRTGRARPGRSARLHGLHLSPSISGGARPGLFIAFEGVEGAGKSTQMKRLYEDLTRRGREVVVTREPGGAPIAERIRAIVLDPSAREMDPKAEALLYAASRAQLVSEVIKPALERGAVVLCDRYIDSSLAYQGFARGLGEDDVLRLNLWGTDGLLPDLVVLLHLEPEAGLARTQGSPDRIEQEDVGFHRKVGEAYLSLARAYPSRFAVVAAAGTVEQVHEQVSAAILPFLRED